MNFSLNIDAIYFLSSPYFPLASYQHAIYLKVFCDSSFMNFIIPQFLYPCNTEFDMMYFHHHQFPEQSADLYYFLLFLEFFLNVHILTLPSTEPETAYFLLHVIAIQVSRRFALGVHIFVLSALNFMLIVPSKKRK